MGRVGHALQVGLAVLVVALTLRGVPLARASGPSFTMTPTAGPPGTVIAVEGRDWLGVVGVTEVVFVQFGSSDEIYDTRPSSGAITVTTAPDKTGSFHASLDTSHYKGTCGGGGCQLCVTDNHILPLCQLFTLSAAPGGQGAPGEQDGTGGACSASPDAVLSLPASHTLAPGRSAGYTAGGFKTGGQVTVQLTSPAGAGGPPANVTVDGSCAIQATITVPADSPPGAYSLTASGPTPSGGTRTWTTTFQVAGAAQTPATPASSPVSPAAPSTLARDCTTADAAFGEAFLRLKATRLALERERNLHSLIDQAHEDLRQSIYAGAVVDLAALAPGWPLSSGVANRFFDEEKHKLVNSLLNAGLTSVETRIARDQSLAGVGDQLTTLDLGTGLPIDGAPADVAWEGVKTGLEGAMGETAASVSFFAFDLLKFGLSAYEGKSQLDASLDMLRRVNEHISQLEALDGELSGVITDAQSAQEYCQQQIADGRPFDTNDPALTRVRAYLGPEQGA